MRIDRVFQAHPLGHSPPDRVYARERSSAREPEVDWLLNGFSVLLKALGTRKSSRTLPPAIGFDWRTAVWHLRTLVLAALFQQLSQPGRLQPLGLVVVLDWISAVLDRVDRTAFFSRFDEGAAISYFYEPFLEAFDPDLRKHLGVWYKPSEAVRHVVARVDRALKDDLGIAEGLVAENDYALDSCCRTEPTVRKSCTALQTTWRAKVSARG